MELPSKELLSEVLGVNILTEIHEDDLCEDNILIYWEFDGRSNNCRNINIYELAYKCKEWAWRNYHYTLSSEYADNEYSCSATLTWHDFKNYPCTIEEYPIVSDTEPEAIFKACQWILDNKDK